MAREGIKINLPQDVYRTWDRARTGYPNTMFGMGCLAAFLTLSQVERDELMTRVGFVDEKEQGWDRVLEWAEQLRQYRIEKARQEGDRLRKAAKRSRQGQEDKKAG